MVNECYCSPNKLIFVYTRTVHSGQAVSGSGFFHSSTVAVTARESAPNSNSGGMRGDWSLALTFISEAVLMTKFSVSIILGDE